MTLTLFTKMRRLVTQTILLVSFFRQNCADTVCECGPRHYSFRLNFSGTCDDPALQNDPDKGYTPFICVTDVLDYDKCDFIESPDCLVPVNITDFFIMEHENIGLSVIFGGFRHLTYSPALQDGDHIEYTSVTNVTTFELVKMITIRLIGYNAVGAKVDIFLAWMYTNECEVNPLNPKVEPWGTGWIQATDDTILASPSTCQYPSSSPSQTPTLSRPPSQIPSRIPTFVPTATPSIEPTMCKICLILS